jgi:hypothetical protein
MDATLWQFFSVGVNIFSVLGSQAIGETRRTVARDRPDELQNTTTSQRGETHSYTVENIIVSYSIYFISSPSQRMF